MNKPRVMIFALLGIALSGTAYWFLPSFLPPSTHVASERQPGETKPPSAQLSEELKRDALTHKERYILERAAADWPRDPFEKPKAPVPREITAGKTATPAVTYVYSGYVEVDKKRLAIINGMQYQVGDQLESGRYAVRSIENEKVVLEHVGKSGVLILPFVGGGF